ncbi:hypothetical protein Ade02nite_01320 [Paractinoplanes deccanensis]|uniref:Uncharacterized protein n=1 Tax=Paractinoplanes deccanensis TaxID=113561 RepID=A0ABQ3XUS1_9ACTN|nr:hypothetical protein Ade02nite_01320 [Actinoplanes deccanensis]
MIIATHVPSERLRFLGSPKFAGGVAVVGVVIALLAYIGDVQGRQQPDVAGPVASASASGVGAASTAASPSSSAASTATSPTASREAGGTGSFELSTRRLDDRTVEVDITPPADPAEGRAYWFFVEVDWRDGNTDYYPREQLTSDAQTLTVAIPPDATLDADRTGRVYGLTPAQSTEAGERLKRQQTTRQNDFFPNVFGTAASASVKLPFGA